jgi:dihydrofolate synthase/folylpolyglutamate synthase
MTPPVRSEAAISQLVNAPKPGIKLSLEHLHAFFAALGNPHVGLPPTIHVAGTNGKGSTIAFLRAIYEAAGLRVHTYTSPHLVSFHERICLAGTPIDDAMLLALIARVQSVMATHPVTFFEATTAVAFLAFQQVKADVLLLEVGMGGRLDTTNIIPEKIASLITPIAMDHAEFIGDTISKIAAEKAGIMAANTPVFSAHQHPDAAQILQQRAQQLGALWQGQVRAPYRGKLGLAGAHQQYNAALAAWVARSLREQLPISENAIERGLAQARWPARAQRLIRGPLVALWGNKGEVILDGAHNEAAAQALAAHIAAPATLICGVMRRKDVDAYLRAIKPIAAYFIAVPIPGMESECMPASALAARAKSLGISNVLEGTLTQLSDLLPKCATQRLVVCGSLYLAGEILKNHG